MNKENKQKYGLLAVCFVAIMAMAVILPDFLSYDIGYKNAQIVQMVTDQPIADNLKSTEFTLPIVYIQCAEQRTLLDKTLAERPQVSADIYVLDRGVNSITDTPTHVYKNAFMSLRGNSTAQHQSKKSFNVDFINPDGTSLNLPFLDMPAESDFVLYAPYLDRSLIRNYLGYVLQSQVQEWGPECVFVELFLDVPGTDLSFKDYQGVYMATENFKRGVNRINVGNFTVADNPDRQFEDGGGYIYKMDWYHPERDNVIRLQPNKHGNEYSLVYPKPQNMTDEYEQIIFEEIEMYEDALYNGTDAELAQYFDLEEIARNMLVSEFLKNHEAYSASTFFYRQVGGRIKVVQWDYDLGTGNISSVLYQEPSREDFWVLSHWPMPQAFLKHKNFQQIMIQQWEILRQGALSEENIVNMLDELEILLADAGVRNDLIFPDAFYAPQFAIWENNLESSREERQFVKQFLIERGRWLDEHIYDIAQ